MCENLDFLLRLIPLLLVPVSLFAGRIEEKIQKELELLHLPATTWRVEEDGSTLDVAVIGAGQAGLAIGYALKLEGIADVRIFDAADEGEEGPWLTTARMLTLRSSKFLRGPAQLAHLTFRAWCEEKYGKKCWEEMGKIPTKAWGQYLVWLKSVMELQVTNGAKLVSIEPNLDDSLTLTFEDASVIRCRKVVLATGRTGFGGAEVPAFIQSLAKKYWAHTSERIDPKFFTNKRIAVVGVGASGFDAAASALENGAKRVDMLMRRAVLPAVNHAAQFAYPGFMRGFYHLSDEERYEFTRRVLSDGIPPPQESVERLAPFSNFTLVDSCQLTGCQEVGSSIQIDTSHGRRFYDYIVLATGYKVDSAEVEELGLIADKILLWRDRMPEIGSAFGRFAYLGPHFEFLERLPGECSALKNIHCFNFGAFMSHGRISGDLDGLHIGVQRLVEGIAVDLFLQDTCRNGGPTPNECPGTCQIGLCSPFSLQTESN